MMLVDVPKPFSIRCGGMVSSSILGVAQIMTPAENPKSSRPKHKKWKLCMKEKAVPIRPIKLNAMIEILLPYLIKSPPNMDPKEMPTIFEEDSTVVYQSIFAGSSPQLSWYFKELKTVLVLHMTRPICMLLIPMITVKPII